jgi:serine/threonine-protein kinase
MTQRGIPDSIDSAAADDRARRISLVVFQFLSRRNRGEAVDPSEYEASHADLMPELRAALEGGMAKLRSVLRVERGNEDQDATSPESRIARPVARGYRIVREINRGGQGAVYEALQEVTGRTVALKVVTAATPSSVVRFEREAQALASVNHPGVVSIVDRGRTLDHAYFLAMEYVEGENLDDWLIRVRREPIHFQDRVVRLFRDLAKALAAAHERGIVHRDLKPSNIRIDRLGHPRILDFGLAHLINLGDDYAARELTRTGNIIGSIPWISPEQASGQRRELSPASDVYTLGVVLYHALVGRFPYDTSGPLHTVTRHICETTPSFPAKVDPRLQPVNDALAAIVMKCLAKDPRDRFEGAMPLAEALQTYLDGALESRSPWGWRRHWLIGALLAGCGVLGLSYFLSHRAPPPTTELLGIALPTMTNSIGMRFIQAPAGQFTMGSPINEAGHQDQEPVHFVQISKPFFIGCTEVTQGQYRKVMGELPAVIDSQSDDLPVDYVTWLEATEFCHRLSKLDGRPYRLPTEAEWEYACRAGSRQTFSGTGKLDEMGWYAGNSKGHLMAVRSKAANHWGLYDMHGDAREWVADGYVPDLGSKLQRDPINASDNGLHVARGGAFNDPELNCRAAFRSCFTTDAERPGIGFRVVAAPTLTP